MRKLVSNNCQERAKPKAEMVIERHHYQSVVSIFLTFTPILSGRGGRSGHGLSRVTPHPPELGAAGVARRGKAASATPTRRRGRGTMRGRGRCHRPSRQNGGSRRRPILGIRERLARRCSRAHCGGRGERRGP